MPVGDWAIFFVSAVSVVGAGIAIGRVSGELGERLGLGRAWAGAVLLSFATTLPELVTTITVSLEGAYGLAWGGILGSVVFNLFILAVVDLADPDPLYHRLSKNHLATGLLGAGLLAILMVGLSLGMASDHKLITISPALLLLVPISIFSLYALGQFVLFKISKQSFGKEMNVPTRFSALSSRQLVIVYCVTAGVIVIAARSLGLVVDRLAIYYRLAATFAGATMLGIVTSLPEITNAIACSRQREYDLAVGNILGANALVITVLALAGALVGNRIFSSIPFQDSISAFVMAGLAVLMQAVALGALAVESHHHLRRISIASMILAALYAASLYLAYQFSA